VIEDAVGERVAIAYGERGSGQPLFLLHGIGSWSYAWRQSVELLSQQFRVICLDAKGSGFSDAPFRPDVVGHQIVELERAIQALADQPAIAVAESMGALATLGVAQKTPDLLDRLVLINVPIFPRRLPSLGMRVLANFPLSWVRQVDQSRLVRPFAPVVRHITRIARREVVYDSASITDEEIYWLTYPYIEFPGKITRFATDLQHAAREIERFLADQPNLISTIQENLNQVTCPALILWGECDRWFPVQDGEKLHQCLPNALFQVIPQCGHNASSSCPDAVNQAILDFVGDQGSGIRDRGSGIRDQGLGIRD
jgi:pimeloyl-ACP methyl ester carboxylesterase